MSVQRIFSLFCCILALFGIVGALKHPMITTNMNGIQTVSIGFFPLLYSLALFFFGILLVFSDKSNSKINLRVALLTGVGGQVFAFFLLLFLLVLLLYVFGSFIAILVFCILACLVLKRLTTPWIVILFSIIFTSVFYFLFVMIFKMAFRRGIIFEALGWHI